MIIADSSHNRFIIVDLLTMKFLEAIGNGRQGDKDGSFSEAEFYHTQGMTHFINDNHEHCLMVCDTKNHIVKEVNLHKKTVRRVVGQTGMRGFDRTGGKKLADQQIASPWDIMPYDAKEGKFIVCMAGTH